MIASMEIAVNCVINMEETNLPYEISPKTPLESGGARSVLGKTPGSTGICSVALAVPLGGPSRPPRLFSRVCGIVLLYPYYLLRDSRSSH